MSDSAASSSEAGPICPACNGQNTVPENPEPWLWCWDCATRFRGSMAAAGEARLQSLVDWITAEWRRAPSARERWRLVLNWERSIIGGLELAGDGPPDRKAAAGREAER